MKSTLKGKGIFVFSQAASSNAVFALVNERNSYYDTYQNHSIVVTNAKGIIPLDLKKITSIRILEEPDFSFIAEEKPDFIFTGTSLTDYEIQWWIAAAKTSVRSIAFIDHFCNYKERFILNDIQHLPDEIWVINDQAKDEAVQNGLPESIIRISDNPYYDYVKNFKPEVGRQEFLSDQGIDPSKNLILYIEDDLKRSFGTDTEGNCTLGYDEYSTLSDILTVLRQLHHKDNIDFSDKLLIIKLHPVSEKSKYLGILNHEKDIPIEYVILQDADPLCMIYYSELVLGMFSNMVIEALLMNMQVIRVQINQKGEDFLSRSVHLQRPTVSLDELSNKLLKYFKTQL